MMTVTKVTFIDCCILYKGICEKGMLEILNHFSRPKEMPHSLLYPCQHLVHFSFRDSSFIVLH